MQAGLCEVAAGFPTAQNERKCPEVRLCEEQNGCSLTLALDGTARHSQPHQAMCNGVLGVAVKPPWMKQDGMELS